MKDLVYEKTRINLQIRCLFLHDSTAPILDHHRCCSGGVARSGRPGAASLFDHVQHRGSRGVHLHYNLPLICRRSQTSGRNSCSIASGDVSNWPYRLNSESISCHEFASQFGLEFFLYVGLQTSGPNSCSIASWDVSNWPFPVTSSRLSSAYNFFIREKTRKP